MKTNIFETKAEMPPPDNSNGEVVCTALTMRDHVMHNHIPALTPINNGVQSVQRPRRGHDY